MVFSHHTMVYDSINDVAFFSLFNNADAMPFIAFLSAPPTIICSPLVNANNTVSYVTRWISSLGSFASTLFVGNRFFDAVGHSMVE